MNDESKKTDDAFSLAKSFVEGKVCSVCKSRATGVGDGVFYCNQHFFAAFDEMELKKIKNHIVVEMKKLTPEQRLDVIHEFCFGCGDDNPKCQCWNDE